MTETSPPYQSWVTTVLVDSYCAEEFSTRLSIHHADMAFWMVSAVFKIELSYCPNSLLEYRSACIALECARKTSLIIGVLRFYRPHGYHPFPFSSSSLTLFASCSARSLCPVELGRRPQGQRIKGAGIARLSLDDMALTTPEP
jgi:hypothetical protein